VAGDLLDNTCCGYFNRHAVLSERARRSSTAAARPRPVDTDHEVRPFARTDLAHGGGANRTRVVGTPESQRLRGFRVNASPLAHILALASQTGNTNRNADVCLSPRSAHTGSPPIRSDVSRHHLCCLARNRSSTHLLHRLCRVHHRGDNGLSLLARPEPHVCLFTQPTAISASGILDDAASVKVSSRLHE
jgi:hypothetical protein